MDKAHSAMQDPQPYTGASMPTIHAMASTVSRGWVAESMTIRRRSDASLDANQLTSIAAMISYISRHSGQTEFRVERALADRFKVPNAKCLPSASFDDALRYLADIIAN